MYVTQIQLGWESTEMIPSVSVTHKDDGQELLNWWMPPPELLCQMIVNSRLFDCQKCQLSTSSAKGGTAQIYVHGHRLFCLEAVPSLMATVLQCSVSIVPRLQTLLGVGVWMFMRETSGSQMHQLHCQLCSLPTTLQFSESWELFCGCTAPFPKPSCSQVADQKGFLRVHWKLLGRKVMVSW